MPDKCGKCDEAILPTSVSVKCGDCKRVFHVSCTRSANEQNFTKSRNKAWKCDECGNDSSSQPSTRSTEEVDDKNSILDAIRTMKMDIIKNTDDKIEIVLNSVSALSEDMKTLKNSVAVLQSSHSELEVRCGRLENVNSELQDEVWTLRQQLRDTEQYQRSNNIELVGLPSTEGENIYNCLQQVAKALGLAFRREEISIAHRLHLFSKKRHSHPPIICQFVSRSVKATWMSAARSKENFDAKDVNKSLPASRLFLNDHLTRDNKVLLGKARRLQKEKCIHFAGYFNGKVLIKPSAEDKSFQVTDVCQLDKYDKKLNVAPA